MHKSRSNVLLQAYWKGLVCGGPTGLASTWRRGQSQSRSGSTRQRQGDQKNHEFLLSSRAIIAFHLQSSLLSNIHAVPTDIPQARNSAIDNLRRR